MAEHMEGKGEGAVEEATGGRYHTRALVLGLGGQPRGEGGIPYSWVSGAFGRVAGRVEGYSGTRARKGKRSGGCGLL